MEKLLGKSPAELGTVALNCGLKPFVAKQIARWLYVSKVRSIDEMTNISKEGRETLKRCYDLGVSAPIGKAESSDGTLKYLFKVQNSAIESVVIPDGDRSTLCVSSQAGCRMNCKFCMTGRQGFHGSLSASLWQATSSISSCRLTCPRNLPMPCSWGWVSLSTITIRYPGR